MRKLKLYTAMSLDGKIARSNGSIDWLNELPNPDSNDYGYANFYASVGVTLQGNTTYQQVLSFPGPFPYPDTTNYIFSRQADRQDTEHVQFVSGNIASFVEQLKEEDGPDIWLIGGGQINTVLLNAGLIDQMHLFVMPLVLGTGLPLFASTPTETQFTLSETIHYQSGAAQLLYV